MCRVHFNVVYWGKGFHDGDEQEQMRSETMHKIADLSKIIHTTPEFTWKTQTGKNHGVAHKFTIIDRIQEEENLTVALYNSFHRFVTSKP